MLTQITDAAGRARTFAYADLDDGVPTNRITADTYGHYVRTWTYASGAAATSTAGSGAEAATTTLSSANVQGLAALVAGTVQARGTDGLGHATRSTLDSGGRPLEQLAADGGLWTWQRYADTTFVQTLTDPLGRATGYQYHAVSGDVTQVTPPDGKTRLSEITNVSGDSVPRYRTTRLTDERGFQTNYAYDSLGHLTTETNALGQVTTYSWTAPATDPRHPAGLCKQTTDLRGFTTAHHYDSGRRQDGITEGLSLLEGGTSSDMPSGAVLNDASKTWVPGTWTGKAVVITGGTGAGQRRDITGNSATQLTLSSAWTTPPDDRSTYAIVPATATDHRTTTYSYQAQGDLEFVTSGQAAVNPQVVVTKYVYDLMNRRTQVIEAFNNPSLTRTTTTVYGSPGNVQTVTDPLGRLTEYVYDSVNRVKQAIQAKGTLEQQSTRTSYDAAGNPSQVRDALGRTRAHQYDGLNRTVVVTEALNTPAQRTHRTLYDLVGNTVTTVDPLGRRTDQAYNVRNRQTSRTEAVGTAVQRATLTGYDAAGNVVSVTNPRGFATKHTFDALGRRTETLEVVTDVFSGTAASGSPTTVVRQGTGWTPNAYAGKLVTVTDGPGAGQSRVILSNDSTTLTVTTAWDTPYPAAGSAYVIRDAQRWAVTSGS